MKDIRDLMIYALDNELSPSEQSRLEKALASDPGLRKEQADFLKIRGLLSNFSIAEDPDFSKNVIAGIQDQKSKDHSNPLGAKVFRLFPRVAAASVAILAITLSAAYFTEINFVSDALVGVEDLTLDEAYSYLEY